MWTISIDSAITDPVVDGEDSVINRIDNSEANRAKISAKITKSKTQEKSKNKNLAKSKTLAQSSKSDFLTPKVGQVFTKLRQAFIRALILYYFYLNCHIRIEINTSGYAINRVFSQLILDDMDGGI